MSVDFTHPVTQMAFWRTEPAQVAEMVALFDDLAGSDPQRREKLQKLIDWAREEALLAEQHNQDEAG